MYKYCVLFKVCVSLGERKKKRKDNKYKRQTIAYTII